MVPVNRNQPKQMTINPSLLGKDFKVTDAANELLTYSFKLKAVEASVLIPGNEKVYSNSLLEKIGDMIMSPPEHYLWLKSPSGSYHNELSSAYIADLDDLNHLCSFHLYELTSRRGKQMCFALGVSDTCTTLLTNFVNIFILPLKFSTKILTKIIAITGNREAEGGLETLFVCFEKSDTPLYGTCVSVCILKLSST